MYLSAIFLSAVAISMTTLALYFSSGGSKVTNVTSSVEQSLVRFEQSTPFTILLLHKKDNMHNSSSIAAVIDHVDPSFAENIINMQSSSKLVKNVPFSTARVYSGRPVTVSSDRMPIRDSPINNPNEENLQKGEEMTSISPIIFSASMALVFGAISARRLARRHSILSACVETEIIEDDIIYDSAYTTIISEEDYGSFYDSSITWTGDLEKFDV